MKDNLLSQKALTKMRHWYRFLNLQDFEDCWEFHTFSTYTYRQFRDCLEILDGSLLQVEHKKLIIFSEYDNKKKFGWVANCVFPPKIGREILRHFT